MHSLSPSRLSYGDLAAAAEAASGRLRGTFALQAGEVMAIFLPNGLEFILSWFASLFAGLVDLPIGYEFKKTTLLHALTTAQSRVVVTDASGFERLLDEELRPRLSSRRVLVAAGDLAADAARQQLAEAAIALTVIALDELVAAGPVPRLWDSIEATALASIRYTSGTALSR